VLRAPNVGDSACSYLSSCNYDAQSLSGALPSTAAAVQIISELRLPVQTLRDLLLSPY